MGRKGKRRELNDILTILGTMIIVFGIVAGLSFTPLLSNTDIKKYNDQWQFNYDNSHVSYVTIQFNDELSVQALSYFYVPSVADRNFEIKRDLRTLNELSSLVGQGYHIANFSVRSLSFTVQAEFMGTSVITQVAGVNVFVNGNNVSHIELQGTKLKPISLSFDDLNIQDYKLVLQFGIGIAIQALNGQGQVTITQISVSLQVILTKNDTNTGSEQTPSPEPDSDVYVYGGAISGGGNFYGPPTISYVSWLSLLFYPTSILWVIVVVILIWLLMRNKKRKKRQKRIRR